MTMTQSLEEKERRAVAVRATLVACCALLLFTLGGTAGEVHRRDGNNVMMRLMGLILMVIAVECFVSGARPILESIVHS